MSRQPRFEVVRSDAGWFARFVAANGREVWRTSETYTRRRSAVDAMWLMRDRTTEHFMWAQTKPHCRLEVREVDGR